MSKMFPHRAAADDQDVPQVGPDVQEQAQQPSPSHKVTFSEPSSQIWVPYLRRAAQFDKDLVESWRDDMEALLIFAALFSASVTTFSVASYTTLKEDPADVTISILLQISRQLSNSTQNTVASRPSSFQPSSTDVAVNICWFLSLGFSLACSLGAVLIRQWARNYLRAPRSLTSIKERARMRQYLFEKLEWWRMEIVVETIPALLHISLVLFFTGLLLYLREVNYSVALAMFCFCTIAIGTYVTLTIIPVIFPGCPYCTPFSRSASLLFWGLWRACIMAAAVFVTFFECARIAARKVPALCFPSTDQSISWPPAVFWQCLDLFNNLFDRSRHLHDDKYDPMDAIKSIKTLHNHVAMFPRRQKITEKLDDLKETSGQDSRALKWTVELSNSDADFFEIVQAIPDFFKDSQSSDDGDSRGLLFVRQSILVDSGIAARIMNEIHRCCANDQSDDGTRPYLEALHWVIRCPSLFPPDHRNTSPTLTRASLQCRMASFTRPLDLDILEEVWYSMDTSKMAYRHSCLLREVHATEQAVIQWESQHDPTNSTSAIPVDVDISWRVSQLENHAHAHRFGIEPYLPPDAMSDTTTLLRCLGQFRQSGATSTVVELTPRLGRNGNFQDMILLRSVADALTHLDDYPRSTSQSQIAVFRVMDRVMRAQLHQAESYPGILAWYRKILYGRHISFGGPTSRGDLHSNFFSDVSVQETYPGCADVFGYELWIAHDDHSRILVQLLASLKATSGGLSEKVHDDCHAAAIVEYIQRRRPFVESLQPVTTIASDEHLKITQELLVISKCKGLLGLLRRTADALGWGERLRENRHDANDHLEHVCGSVTLSKTQQQF